MAPGSVVAQPVGAIGAGSVGAQLLTPATGGPLATPFRVSLDPPVTLDPLQFAMVDGVQFGDTSPSDDADNDEPPSTSTPVVSLELSTIPQPVAVRWDPPLT